MDCREAEFYRNLRHPNTDELGPEVAALLEQHLSSCEKCAAAEKSLRSFDRSITTAIRDVAIPSGLHGQLTANSKAILGKLLRRRIYRSSAMVASLLVLTALAIGFFSASRPRPDTQVWAMNADNLLDPELAEAAVRKWLLAKGFSPQLPLNFDFSLLITFGTEEVNGRDAPVVVFRDRNSNGFAKIFLLRDTQFDLKDLRDAQASYTQIRIFPDRQSGVAYAVVFTGPSLVHFLRGNQQG